MDKSLDEQRRRLQREVQLLEESLSRSDLQLFSHDSDESSSGDSEEDQDLDQTRPQLRLLAQRDLIQRQIQDLEKTLGPTTTSNKDLSDEEDSSGDEGDLELPPSVESCLQINLVYQQVIQETLDQLDSLLHQNQNQQKELLAQMSGSIKDPTKPVSRGTSHQHPSTMYLGRFLKPYFKDKLTGLGPPANQETKEKASKRLGALDDKKTKIRRWEGWQKVLLIHAVSRDRLRKLIQPKLSKLDFLTQKLSLAPEVDRPHISDQIQALEKEIQTLREKKEVELMGNRHEDVDWDRISNIDFEGSIEADDLRLFWQNFLHPSIKKDRWSDNEVQRLKEISLKNQERDWDKTAAELGSGRTAFMCLQTYQRFVSDSLRKKWWTPEEDAQLRELVEKMRIGNFIPYTQICYFMEDRLPAQVIYRWNQVLDPRLKKGTWSPEEDQLLLKAVEKHGAKHWWKIRYEVPGRTDSACRDRYHDCLNAETRKGPFDEKERLLLWRSVERHGAGRWAKIAMEVPNRTDAQCMREWRKMVKDGAACVSKDTREELRKEPNMEAVKETREEPNKEAVKKTEKDIEQNEVNTQPSQKRRPCTRAKTEKALRRGLRKRKAVRLKEEFVETISDEEELEEVPYIDISDDEENQAHLKVISEKTQTEKQTDAVLFLFVPHMNEWVPTRKSSRKTFNCFRPVALAPAGNSKEETVRCTIVDKSERSVLECPPPKPLQWDERSSVVLMMISCDELRELLHQQVYRSSHRKGRKQNYYKFTDQSLVYELQAAITPWIGNVVFKTRNKLTVADVLRQRGGKLELSSSEVFRFLLRALNVDGEGCKLMIKQRKKKTSPTVADILKMKRVKQEAENMRSTEFKSENYKINYVQQQNIPTQQKQEQVILLPPESPAPFFLQSPPTLPPQVFLSPQPLLFPNTQKQNVRRLPAISPKPQNLCPRPTTLPQNSQISLTLPNCQNLNVQMLPQNLLTIVPPIWTQNGCLASAVSSMSSNLIVYSPSLKAPSATLHSSQKQNVRHLSAGSPLSQKQNVAVSSSFQNQSLGHVTVAFPYQKQNVHQVCTPSESQNGHRLFGDSPLGRVLSPSSQRQRVQLFPDSSQTQKVHVVTVYSPASKQNVRPASSPVPLALKQNVRPASSPVPPALKQNVRPASSPVPLALKQNVRPASSPVPLALKQNVRPASSPVPLALKQNVRPASSPVPLALKQNVRPASSPVPPALKQNVHPASSLVPPASARDGSVSSEQKTGNGSSDRAESGPSSSNQSEGKKRSNSNKDEVAPNKKRRLNKNAARPQVENQKKPLKTLQNPSLPSFVPFLSPVVILPKIQTQSVPNSPIAAQLLSDWLLPELSDWLCAGGESQKDVSDWLSGKGGVAAEGLSKNLPYLAPFVSSLSALCLLLKHRTGLSQSAAKILGENEGRKLRIQGKMEQNQKEHTQEEERPQHDTPRQEQRMGRNAAEKLRNTESQTDRLRIQPEAGPNQELEPSQTEARSKTEESSEKKIKQTSGKTDRENEPTADNKTQQRATRATSQTAPGATSQTAPGATSQTAHGATSQTAPGATSQTAHGATSQTAPGATSQMAFGATSQTAHGATSQTAPGATSQTAHGPTSQMAPGPTSQMAPGATSQMAPGATSQTAHGATSQTASGATSQTAFGATSQTAPGATSQTAELRSGQLSNQETEAVRQMVRKRFGSNPAYQLLKARFLSVFTFPALLASLQPITEQQDTEGEEPIGD